MPYPLVRRIFIIAGRIPRTDLQRCPGIWTVPVFHLVFPRVPAFSNLIFRFTVRFGKRQPKKSIRRKFQAWGYMPDFFADSCFFMIFLQVSSRIGAKKSPRNLKDFFNRLICSAHLPGRTSLHIYSRCWYHPWKNHRLQPE